MLNRLEQGKNSTSTILANFATFILLHLIYISLYRHYDFSDFRPPNKKEVGVMWDNSPIAHLDHVKAPTLIALGLKDRRVPPSQGQFLPFPLPVFLDINSHRNISGIEYYHALRAKGVPAKLLLYDDCDHAIDLVVSEADHWINTKRWFDQYL